MTLKEISNALHAPISASQHTTPIDAFFIDSRQIPLSKQALFFAIKGQKHDGHQYIAELVNKGVRYFVVEHVPLEYQETADLVFLPVANALEAFQKLAAAYRTQFKFPVLAITGSNGKTIVKEWLYTLLWPLMHVVRSPKSYNSQVGVPLSVLNTDSKATFGIFEAGISKPNEMAKLQAILSPNLGLFTGIGSAHDSGFKDRCEKITEKLKLFSTVECLFLCEDEQEVVELLPDSIQTFSYSKKGNPAQVQVLKIEKLAGYSTIHYLYEKTAVQFNIPFTDEASIDNSLLCLLVLLYFQVGVDYLQEHFEKLEPVEMRLELKRAIGGGVLVSDVYNSDVDSLKIALQFFDRVDEGRTRGIIFSEIHGNDLNTDALYQQVSNMVNHSNFKKVYLVGPALEKYTSFFTAEHVHFFTSTPQLIQYLKQNPEMGMSFLLKGARDFTFEQVAQLLEERLQETILEIDLKSIEHNLAVYRNLLPPQVKCMAMLKAFGYGGGSFEIAKVLQYNHIEYIGVAYVDEGISLRAQGITLPIMVMNPVRLNFAIYQQWDLEPVIHSLSMLQECVQWAKQQSSPLRIHLEFDTGMHRLGFDSQEQECVLTALKEAKSLRVCSVFSHLVASLDSTHDAFTEAQIQKFKAICTYFSSHLPYAFDTHILNSGGIERFVDNQFSMVRLGIGLYGVGGDALKDQLQLAYKLSARVSKISTLEAGESVSYNRRYKATKATKIATISMGYADGLKRILGNEKGWVYIQGVPVPIIGDVCMDMCMLDVSALPFLREGDEVVVFENEQQLNDLSKAAQTIPYEILTSISQRVKRVYRH